MKYYKVLNGNRSCHGGEMKWPLPADGPGEWVQHDGPIVPCSKGLHVTTQPSAWFDKSGLSVFEVQIEGEIHPCDTDEKFVCRRVRLMKLLSGVELALVSVFMSGDSVVNKGLIVAYGSATVTASDSATVRAYGSATVTASDSATVRASGSATVRAYGSSTVRATGSSTVTAYGSSTVRATDSSTVRAYGSSTVTAYGSSTVTAYGSSTVRATGSSTVTAYGSSTVTASGSATVRAFGSATVENYSPRNKIELHFLAIQIDRSKASKAVIRHSKDSAVTLEAS